MPPRTAGTRSLDYYASVRCQNCLHLRYKGQEPGDPCLICGCEQHIVPADQAGQP